jgi:hypothetical protein
MLRVYGFELSISFLRMGSFIQPGDRCISLVEKNVMKPQIVLLPDKCDIVFGGTATPHTLN